MLFAFTYDRCYLRVSQAVKRSRVKSKLRTQQTLERVNQLKTENELLEEKIKMLTKELGFLKDLFIAHAGTVKMNYYQIVESSDMSYDVNYDNIAFHYIFCCFLRRLQSTLHKHPRS